MSSLSEDGVRQLAKKGRKCVIYEGGIYDVTDFVPRHPGGSKILLEQSGKDVTQAMHCPEVHNHTEHAFSILNKYYVGHLQTSTEIGEDECLDSLPADKAKKYFYNRREEYIDPVDWSKPVLPQIPKLGSNYYEWVHQPTDNPLRLFNTDFVEYFSKCSWWMVPTYWVPVLIIMMWTAYTNLSVEPELWMPWMLGGIEITTSRMPFLFLMGTLSWTLVEYVIHRWVFHLRPPTNFSLVLQLHFLLHGQHHKAPMEKGRLVFPLVPANIVAILLFTIYRSMFPVMMVLTILSGTTLGYISYDLTHYYLHHGTPSLQYFKNLKRYHVKHHFEQQHKGFGISSKLWDYPFNTLISE